MENKSISSPQLSKVEQAYSLLEEKIITMQLMPGQLLSENELAHSLNLGRTPVREALQKLASQKLIQIMPRRGIRVSDIDISAQIRLLEVRRVLEQLQAKLAAQRANENQKQRFLDIADDMEYSANENDYLSFVRLDSEYNQLMAEACHNEFVEPALVQLHGLSRRFWHQHSLRGNSEKPHALLEAARLHAQVARAIAKGDSLFAESAAKEHMNYIYELTKSTIKQA
jgi:DNA-binding GntR family transcriptional regulator